MKWMSSFLSVSAMFFGTLVWGCPFCGGPPTQTWSELIADADVVVLVKLISADEGGRGRKPLSIVELVRSHKGGQHLPTERPLRVPQHLPGKAGDLFIVNGSLRNPNVPAPDDTFADDDEASGQKPQIRQASASDTDTNGATVADNQKTLVWDLNQQVSESTFNYIAEAPGLDQNASTRLAYFAKFLESDDDLIAVDAWSEFANSDYEDVVVVQDLLDAAKLRSWVANKEASPERLGLYGMLLGLCGSDADAEFLRVQIGQPANDIRFGVEGLMGGLLLLAEEEGLEFIEKNWLQNSKASTFDAMAAMKAVQFIWAYEPGLFVKQRLRMSLYPLLNRDDLREIAITNLARWEDWSAVAQLTEIYRRSQKDDDDRTTTAVVNFVLTLQEALKEESNNESVATATKLLEEIRAQNPRLVRSAERFFE